MVYYTNRVCNPFSIHNEIVELLSFFKNKTNEILPIRVPSKNIQMASFLYWIAVNAKARVTATATHFE